MAKRVVRNRACLASGTDGTALLANREFGRILPLNSPKVAFSGAARHANKAAGAGYSGDSSRESADRGTHWRRGVDSNCRYRSLNSRTTPFRRRFETQPTKKDQARSHSNGRPASLGHMRIEPYRAAGRGLDFPSEPSVHGSGGDAMKFNGRSAVPPENPIRGDGRMSVC
jgi:hypothetical protein